LLPLLDDITPHQSTTVFAALVSAARGESLRRKFRITYHFRIDRSLFDWLYAEFVSILGS